MNTKAVVAHMLMEKKEVADIKTLDDAWTFFMSTMERYPSYVEFLGSLLNAAGIGAKRAKRSETAMWNELSLVLLAGVKSNPEWSKKFIAYMQKAYAASLT